MSLIISGEVISKNMKDGQIFTEIQVRDPRFGRATDTFWLEGDTFPMGSSIEITVREKA